MSLYLNEIVGYVGGKVNLHTYKVFFNGSFLSTYML
jgi:hypothetical protein